MNKAQRTDFLMGVKNDMAFNTVSEEMINDKEAVRLIIEQILTEPVA